MARISSVTFDDPDAMRLLQAYFAELVQRFGAFEPPSRAALETDARDGVVLVAHENGQAVACGSLRRFDANTLEVKRMFVDRRARSRGLGREMLAALEDVARARGCRRVVLDTASTLVEAAALYLSAGYVEIARYNDNPYAARWFEKKLELEVPRYSTRPATPEDTELLWQMLYYASHSDEEGVSDANALKPRPELARYVAGWGRDTDLGVVVFEATTGRAVGAAWFRLLTGDERGYGWVDDSTPELAIATDPEHRGSGAGTLLLEHVLEVALERFETVCLSCRMQNPARRLYEHMGFVLVPGSEKPNRVGGTSGIMTLTRVQREAAVASRGATTTRPR